MDKYADLRTGPKEEVKRVILDGFDFDRVAGVMAALEWTWWASLGRVPAPDDLRAEGSRLLDLVLYDGASRASCGGLVARYELDEDEYYLEFVLEWWAASPSECG